MIKRIIEISKAKTYLSVRNEQLIIRQEEELSAQIPCEDVGLLIIDHNGTTYTHSVFTNLIKHGAAIVFCGSDHHPCGYLLPTAHNSLQSARLRYQIAASEPLKKRLWKQIIKAKIFHQASVVGEESSAYAGLRALARQVKSGDPDNKEAQASKLFWKYFLAESRFRRGRDGPAPNNLLNYGYAILRAAIARAIVGSGLNPSIGIKHCSQYNAFCLADDLIEPFRGFIEAKVLNIWQEVREGEEADELSQAMKSQLLEVLYQQVKFGDYSGPLMVGLHRVTGALVKCYTGEEKQLVLPDL